jgi:hypothetical protein
VEDLAYHAPLLVADVLGHGPVVPDVEDSCLDPQCLLEAPRIKDGVHSSLTQQFRRLADEELMIRDICIVGRKPMSRDAESSAPAIYIVGRA